MLLVEDPDDPRLDDYRHLTDRAALRAVDPDDAPFGVLVVEGAVALEQLLASRHLVRSVLLTPARARSIGTTVEAALGDRAPILVVDREVLAAVTGYDVHRGVLAAAARPEPTDPASVVAGSARIVVVESVSDNENVGALFRNAAALGFDGVLLDEACADPLYRRCIRVSSGWTLRLPFARTRDLGATLSSLRRNGVRTIALSPAADARDVDDAALAGWLDDPLALVVGAEGPGLTPATSAACDHRVRVPMAPGADSLNVATALAVVAAFAGSARRWR